MKNNQAIISTILLAFLGILPINGIYNFWATRYTLTSPVIPRKMVDLLSFPHLYIGIILSPFILTSLALHLKKKYKSAIITTLVGMLLHFIYFQYALYSYWQ